MSDDIFLQSLFTERCKWMWSALHIVGNHWAQESLIRPCATLVHAAALQFCKAAFIACNMSYSEATYTATLYDRPFQLSGKPFSHPSYIGWRIMEGCPTDMNAYLATSSVLHSFLRDKRLIASLDNICHWHTERPALCNTPASNHT